MRMLACFDSKRPTSYLKRDEVKTSIGLPSILVQKRFSLRGTNGGTLKSSHPVMRMLQ